jgi:hypothetical protein
VPQEGRRAPAPDQLTYTADFAWPHRWWVARDRRQAATGVEPVRAGPVASLALQNAIRDARILSAVRDEAPAATTSSAARADDHNHDQAAAAPHAVDHPDWDAALTPAQRAAAVQAHQQAAMPEEYLEGRTTDPATWLRTPQNLARLAALTKAADARGRTIADGQEPKQLAKDAADPARQQQHHTAQPDQGRGAGRDR